MTIVLQTSRQCTAETALWNFDEPDYIIILLFHEPDYIIILLFHEPDYIMCVLFVRFSAKLELLFFQL